MTQKNSQLTDLLCRQLGASSVKPIATLQSLWSGYGEIVRYQVEGCQFHSVIVKHIHPPSEHNHPRGWNTDTSHQRKLRSYQVEQYWYEHFAQQCDAHCRVPLCLGTISDANSTLLILEDLDAAGFAQRRATLNDNELHSCLQWLAHFHARFMQVKPEGLWPIGTYWHLDTRPDEWQAMADGQLKQAAAKIDKRLNNCVYTTLVHGDAKVANFCFSNNSPNVAAVDFQYVGGGCGMKDVAYFMGSCMNETECAQYEQHCLEVYFTTLKNALNQLHPQLDSNKLEDEWRSMYAIAWTDFTRFMLGWMPTHKKINHYSTKMSERALACLDDD